MLHHMFCLLVVMVMLSQMARNNVGVSWSDVSLQNSISTFFFISDQNFVPKMLVCMKPFINYS